MSDQKSIWKKELKLRKQPASTPVENPASPPEKQSGSIWKKEIGFRKGSKQNGSKQNGQEPAAIGDEPTGRKASKKELRMRRAVPAKRPIEPQIVLEELLTPADTFATADPADVLFEPEAQAVEPWRPTEAEPESGFAGALTPEDVETPLASDHVAGDYEYRPWRQTSSDLSVVPGLEDNGVGADHLEAFGSSAAELEVGDHDADSGELEESSTPADTFTTADPADVPFEPEAEAVESWQPTEAEPESGFTGALTPEEIETPLSSEHVPGGYDSVPWRQTASDLPVRAGPRGQRGERGPHGGFREPRRVRSRRASSRFVRSRAGGRRDARGGVCVRRRRGGRARDREQRDRGALAASLRVARSRIESLRRIDNPG